MNTPALSDGVSDPFPRTRLCELLGLRYPIIQAGMVWVSGARLAAAAAQAGCLGVVGAGSMKPPVLQEQLKKAKALTDRPIAVNIPLLYDLVPEQIEVALTEGVRVFITSAGSPRRWTTYLKDRGCVVLHVVSHPDLARKCEAAGVDAVVVEGFEAGGHNGRDELTTLVLLQQCQGVVSVPIVAAGGIGSGAAIAAALALGAEGVQIGTLFAATAESSAHPRFKERMCAAGYDETFLRLKSLVPVRLLKNPFAEEVARLEGQCASREDLSALLGKGRARKGMHEGDLVEGELETGQIVSQVRSIPTVAEAVFALVSEYQKALNRLHVGTFS
jgi:enoyl-[acyl-carrier protein] reductase II